MNISCRVCKKEKDEDEFYFKNKKLGIKQKECKICTKEMVTNHYNNNKNYYKNRTKVNKKIKKDWYLNFKNLIKCEKCGEDHPSCLDFHHLNPKDKIRDVADMIHRNYSIINIEKEITKCKILCSNCHRKLHWEERNKPL